MRALLASNPEETRGTDAPVRGLAKFLRRNPTDAERALWDGLTKDRRFASMGFKRQTPVGRHMTDLVSFSLRFVVDIAPAEESEAAGKSRGDKRAWLLDRGYRVIEISAGEIEADIEGALDRIEQDARRRCDLLAVETARLALVVDQLEELFTATDITPEDRATFVRCLDGLSKSGRVFVVATMPPWTGRPH